MAPKRKVEKNQFKRFTFTLNAALETCDLINWGDVSEQGNSLLLGFIPDTDAHFAKFPDVRVCFAQLECAPTTGRIHVQGYLEVAKAKTIVEMKTATQAYFGKETGWKAYFDISRGTREDNERYCSKENTSLGHPSIRYIARDEAEERGDGEELVAGGIDGDASVSNEEKFKESKYIEDMLQAHYSPQEIASYVMRDEELKPQFKNRVYWKVMQFLSSLEKRSQWILTESLPKCRNVEVWVVWGDPGVGKTYSITQRYPPNDVYRWTLSMGQWWDGYLGQRVLIVDDFGNRDGNGRWPLAPSFMLDVLQGYRMQVPVKGGFRYARWELVYIISNFSPGTWYSTWAGVAPELKAAFFSRIPETNVVNLKGRDRRVEALGTAKAYDGGNGVELEVIPERPLADEHLLREPVVEEIEREVEHIELDDLVDM